MPKRTEIPAPLEPLAALCAEVAAARGRLSERLDQIRARREKYSRRLLPGLGERSAALSAALDTVIDWIDDHRDLFVRPRTRELAGVKVGLRKLPGRYVIADEAATVRLIREKLPARAATLVQVRETVVREPLKTLTAAELAAVGIALEHPDDEVVVRTPKDDLEKLVDALLAEFEEGRAGP